jgi:hypothetical protein
MKVSAAASVGLCCLVGAFCTTSARAAGGGATIAGAPDLPIGTAVLGGSNATTGTSGEFWRVQLSTGDRFFVEYFTTTTVTVNLDVYSPSVTDLTLANATPVASGETGSKGEAQLSWIATGSGQWIVRLSCDCGSGPALAYEFTAQIQRFTRAVLQAPVSVGAGVQVSVRGTVSGTVGGRVALTLTSPGRRSLTGVVPLSSTGSFAWTPRIGQSGTWRLRAVYRGDVTHLPSSATATIRVR